MFIRSFDNLNITKINAGCPTVNEFKFTRTGRYLKLNGDLNAALFTLLKFDVAKGIVFPALRNNELHFYYKGGCLFKFVKGAFYRDINYEAYCKDTDGLPFYQKAKKQNENKFTNLSGKPTERQLLDKLYCHTFDRSSQPSVAVLDIEVNLKGNVGRGRKCDMVLLNTCTDELMFIEGKVFWDSRVNVALSFIPEVIAQVNTYTAAIADQRQNILIQYARHIEIINRLFGTSYRPPKILIDKAKLLVYDTPEIPTKNGAYAINLINTQLGANNVLWVKSDGNPTLERIWSCLSR